MLGFTAIILCLALIFLLIFIYDIKTHKYELPKIMWTHWDKREMPANVKRIWDERQRTLPNWKHILIHDDTIDRYLNKNTFPPNYNSLSPQHRADYIRLALLRKYGGVWADIGILFNEEAAVNKIYDRAVAAKAELAVFRLFDDTDLYLENWFIMAPCNSSLVNSWLDEYVHAINIGFKKYKEHVFASDIKIHEKIYAKDDDMVYLTQHACLQFVIQTKYFKSNMLILDAADSMFAIQIECKWDHDCIIKKLESDRSIKHKYPYIKLRGGDREFDMDVYFGTA
jgi:hypothetical protein